MPILSLLWQFWLYFLRFLSILILLIVQTAASPWIDPPPSSSVIVCGVFFLLNDLVLYVLRVYLPPSFTYSSQINLGHVLLWQHHLDRLLSDRQFPTSHYPTFCRFGLCHPAIPPVIPFFHRDSRACAATIYFCDSTQSCARRLQCRSLVPWAKTYLEDGR
jgi:hypothetical protein